MKRYFLAFSCAASLLMVSCKQAAHLPPGEMVKVLADVHLAEAYSTTAGRDSMHQAGVKNLDSLAVYYRSIFDHHHITEVQFRQSMDWYRDHPEELDTVYARLIPNIVNQQNKQPERASTKPTIAPPPQRLREAQPPSAPEKMKQEP